MIFSNWEIKPGPCANECHPWKSQIVMSKKEKMGLRRKPLVFSEQGVAMLSSVLNSERAVQVNIVIMRAFVRLREWLSAHKDLAHKLDELERKYEKHEVEIQAADFQCTTAVRFVGGVSRFGLRTRCIVSFAAIVNG